MKGYKDSIWGFLGVVVFLSLWQVAAGFNLINSFFLSSPLGIAVETWKFFDSGTIYPHLLVSLQEFSLGFILAAICGIALGFFLGLYRKTYLASYPLILGLYATPVVALFPLFMIWFGIDIWAKVAMVFLGAFFPILINTLTAARNINPDYIRLCMSFGGKKFDVFKTIAFPSSIPYIMAGLKLGIGRGLIGMIVGEFFVSSKGLGYLITYYGATYEAGKLLSVVFVVVVLAIALTKFVEIFEKKFENWKTI